MISELSSPTMTTVDIHIYELGLEATRCLINKIGDPLYEERKVIVPHRLIKRESCK
jgi:DNA-binding LacI/PurR family transcriptional regulator